MIGVVLALVLAGAPTVSDREFDKVQPHWSRWHVQQVFDTTGHRTLMYADEHHRVLYKVYPASDGGLVMITYHGPLCQCNPYEGPYHVFEKSKTNR